MSIQARFLLVLALAGALASGATAADFYGLVDIGAGRTMYLECRGRG